MSETSFVLSSGHYHPESRCFENLLRCRWGSEGSGNGYSTLKLACETDLEQQSSKRIVISPWVTCSTVPARISSYADSSYMCAYMQRQFCEGFETRCALHR